MLVKVISLTFDSTLGGFNDTEIREFLKDKEVISVQDHFFVKNEVPYLTMVIKYFPFRQETDPALAPQVAMTCIVQDVAKSALTIGQYTDRQRRQPTTDPDHRADGTEDDEPVECDVRQRTDQVQAKQAVMRDPAATQLGAELAQVCQDCVVRHHVQAPSHISSTPNEGSAGGSAKPPNARLSTQVKGSRQRRSAAVV